MGIYKNTPSPSDTVPHFQGIKTTDRGPFSLHLLQRGNVFPSPWSCSLGRGGSGQHSTPQPQLPRDRAAARRAPLCCCSQGLLGLLLKQEDGWCWEGCAAGAGYNQKALELLVLPPPGSQAGEVPLFIPSHTHRFTLQIEFAA